MALDSLGIRQREHGDWDADFAVKFYCQGNAMFALGIVDIEQRMDRSWPVEPEKECGYVSRPRDSRHVSNIK